ncbi:MAG: PKD domain-containing protein [Sphingobacteriales bacterium]|nr:PKD domain-containing protein [Sphingobacteriales bacterium]
MKTIVKSFSLFAIGCLTLLSACKKEEYSFGELKNPSGLALTTTLQGAATATPNGDGSGNVSITLAASNVINFKVDFGDGQTQIVSPGTLVHQYANPGTFEYTITVTANGKGGAVSNLSKKITVLRLFNIPTAIMTGLTGGTSKIWIADKDAWGHIGVGPATSFYPEWYGAAANSRTAAEYDDELTFTKTGANSISLVLDNKGNTFIIPDYAGYYSLAGGMNTLNTTGTKALAFTDATSNTTTANSTRIKFTVPGHGLLSWGVGTNTYEILAITSTTLSVRSIGADGNAWYQKFKVK